jgi:hypothetical protein
MSNKGFNGFNINTVDNPNNFYPYQQKPNIYNKATYDNVIDSYTGKFKTSVYVFVLFVLLSHQVAYKVLDMVVKIFINNIEITNEYGEPMPLGVLIMGAIVSLITFIL